MIKNTRSMTSFIDREVSENVLSFLEKHVQVFSSEKRAKADVPHFLVTMYKGIGDAVMVGLSAIDQIIKDDPEANGKIDVLCNGIQAEIFDHDPRINRIILADPGLFPSSEIMLFLKGIKLDASTFELIHFLQDRHYAAIFATMFAPAFYLRLRSPIVFPNLFEVGKDLFAIRRQKDVPMSKIFRRMVSRYFGKEMPISEFTDEIQLYIGSKHVKNARAVVKNIKEWCRVVKPQTLGEFYKQFIGLQTNLDKILVFGYWCEIKQGQPHFTSEDILAKYREARETPPANIGRDLRTLVSKGFLLPPGKSDDGSPTYALSNSGIKEVESKMSQA